MKEIVKPGPAPGLPTTDVAALPCRMRSSSGALRIEGAPVFAGCRCAGDRKDAASDDRADAECHQTPGPKRTLKPLSFDFGLPDEHVDVFCLEKLRHGKRPV